MLMAVTEELVSKCTLITSKQAIFNDVIYMTSTSSSTFLMIKTYDNSLYNDI